MSVLLVADASPLSAAIERKFAARPQAFDTFSSIDEAIVAISACEYDVAIIDLEGDELRNSRVVRTMRSSGLKTPLIALLPVDCAASRVDCLDQGADDCLAKPFCLDELIARVRALSRRRYGLVYDVVQFGQLTFDRNFKTASLDGQALPLTPKEISTLEVLVTHLGKPVHKERIFQKVYGLSRTEVGTGAVEIHISRIRKKIRNTGVRIETIRHFGYQIAEVGQRS